MVFRLSSPIHTGRHLSLSLFLFPSLFISSLHTWPVPKAAFYTRLRAQSFTETGDPPSEPDKVNPRGVKVPIDSRHNEFPSAIVQFLSPKVAEMAEGGTTGVTAKLYPAKEKESHCQGKQRR